MYRHLFGELKYYYFLRWALRNLNDEIPMLDVLPLFEKDNSVLVYAIGFSWPQINRTLNDVCDGWSIEHTHIIDGKRWLGVPKQLGPAIKAITRIRLTQQVLALSPLLHNWHLGVMVQLNWLVGHWLVHFEASWIIALQQHGCGWVPPRMRLVEDIWQSAKVFQYRNLFTILFL